MRCGLTCGRGLALGMGGVGGLGGVVVSVVVLVLGEAREEREAEESVSDLRLEVELCVESWGPDEVATGRSCGVESWGCGCGCGAGDDAIESDLLDEVGWELGRGGD